MAETNCFRTVTGSFSPMSKTSGGRLSTMSCRVAIWNSPRCFCSAPSTCCAVVVSEPSRTSRSGTGFPFSNPAPQPAGTASAASTRARSKSGSAFAGDSFF